MQSSFAGRRKAAFVTMLALAAAALGLALCTAAPAQAGNVGRPHMWPTAGTKATPNPVTPKAVRDHRRGICGPLAKTADDCRKPPGF
jgi:hypothetical protein